MSTDLRYSIEEIDAQEASDMLQLAGLMRALERERAPDDPPSSYEALLARLRSTSPLFQRRYWGARAHGDLIGAAALSRSFTGSNENLRDIDVAIAPEQRRRGIGRSLLARAIEAAGDSAEILLNAWTNSLVPAGIAFAERVGAHPALKLRTSQLDLRTVDRGLLRAWAELAPQGYRLEWVEGSTPDHLMDNVIRALDLMNTAPREELQVEDSHPTPHMVREQERLRRESGQRHLLVLAIDEATRATASFTDLSWDSHVPVVIWQGGTATAPEHRGRGLARWVKARMALRVLETAPEARWIRTGNAGSNDAMLAINARMGFCLAWESIQWQVSLNGARRYVRSTAHTTTEASLPA